MNKNEERVEKFFNFLKKAGIKVKLVEKKNDLSVYQTEERDYKGDKYYAIIKVYKYYGSCELTGYFKYKSKALLNEFYNFSENVEKEIEVEVEFTELMDKYYEDVRFWRKISSIIIEGFNNPKRISKRAKPRIEYEVSRTLVKKLRSMISERIGVNDIHIELGKGYEVTLYIENATFNLTSEEYNTDSDIDTLKMICGNEDFLNKLEELVKKAKEANKIIQDIHKLYNVSKLI